MGRWDKVTSEEIEMHIFSANISGSYPLKFSEGILGPLRFYPLAVFPGTH